MSVTKDSLCAKFFFEFLVGRCDSVEVRESDYDKKGPGSIASSGSDPGLRFSSYLMKHSNNRSDIFSLSTKIAASV